MFRCYVNEHQTYWDKYSSYLTYDYNCSVHSSTGTTTFDLVLSRPPPEFTLQHTARMNNRAVAEQRAHLVQLLKCALVAVSKRLQQTQARH